MVAHESQLHAVPDDLDDDAAVMVEPTACAVHAALRAGVAEGDVVVVLGAGTLGLLSVAALRRLTGAGTIVAAAKHPEQRRLAADLGADTVCEPDEMPRLVRRLTGSMAYGTQLTGGADGVLDCVGSDASIQQSLAVVKPRGRVTLVGMPAVVKLNLTTLWHRETELAGAYAYGTETLADGTARAHLRPRLRPRARGQARAAGVGHLPARRLQGRHRARRQRRPPRRRQGRVRLGGEGEEPLTRPRERQLATTVRNR